MRIVGRLGLVVVLDLVLSACGGAAAPAGPSVTIVINVPVGALPYVAKFSEQGAELAAGQINAAGGVKVGGKSYTIKLEVLDNQLSPSTSLDNVKRAAADNAVAVIDDGYTVDATYQAAAQAGLPILIDYDGNAALIDTDKRANVFRIAPPDDAVAAKLTGYVAGRNLKLALLHDDSEYGKDGSTQFRTALQQKSLTANPDLEIPSTATSLSDKALAVKQAGATGVLIWARAPVLAQMVRALRQGGVTAPIFAGPTAEDPVVRSQLADHPDWVEGLTYAAFRITTEGGPEAWGKFRKAYEDHKFNSGGPDYKVGVQASDHKDVVQPPDWQIFPYDMVYLVKSALEKAGTVDTSGDKIIDALNSVQITSANGDNRGWKKDNHEGVVDDDIYFATFLDMKFKPVQDDPLSKSLVPIDQE